MEFLHFEKVKDGKYLKNYEITYRNKAGKQKTYEIVSRKDLNSIDDVGNAPSGVSIIATMDNKLLLLHEFRMGVNRTVYNLCAGMLEEGESIEECIARELYEETGLLVKEIKIMPDFTARVKCKNCWKKRFLLVPEHSWPLISLPMIQMCFYKSQKMLLNK